MALQLLRLVDQIRTLWLNARIKVLAASFHGPRTSSCDRLNTSFTVSSGRTFPKNGSSNLPIEFERLHEHVRVGDFAGQKVMQCLLGTLIIACLDERLVSLSSARFSRNVRPKVADNVAALLDVSGRPTAALAVQKVRAATLDLEQRSVVNGRLVKLFGMLRNQFADHFEMAEFLDRDILEHVTDASILDVERLHPILQGGSQFAGGPSKLLKKIGNWAAGCQAWINALQGADGAYRRIDWNQRACFGF